MANSTLRAKSSPVTSRNTASAERPSAARHYPNPKHPNEVDPEDCPEVYASVAKGDCLAPIFNDGECFVFSKTEQPETGDYVGIWLHPDVPHADELPRRVKRLRMGLPSCIKLPFRPGPGNEAMPFVELEQFNPPRLLRVRAEHIIAMHKVIGTGITDGEGRARLVPLDTEKMASA